MSPEEFKQEHGIDDQWSVQGAGDQFTLTSGEHQVEIALNTTTHEVSYTLRKGSNTILGKCHYDKNTISAILKDWSNDTVYMHLEKPLKL